MEVNMSTSANGKIVELVDQYIAMWNETDTERRRGLIAKIWTDGASYLDPLLSGEGRDGIDAMVKTVHEQYPGHRFKRTSDVNAHHDRARERLACCLAKTDFHTNASRPLSKLDDRCEGRDR